MLFLESDSGAPVVLNGQWKSIALIQCWRRPTYSSESDQITKIYCQLILILDIVWSTLLLHWKIVTQFYSEFIAVSQLLKFRSHSKTWGQKSAGAVKWKCVLGRLRAEQIQHWPVRAGYTLLDLSSTFSIFLNYRYRFQVLLLEALLVSLIFLVFVKQYKYAGYLDHFVSDCDGMKKSVTLFLSTNIREFGLLLIDLLIHQW